MVGDHEWTKQHETEKEKGRVGSPPVMNAMCTGHGESASVERAQRVLKNSRIQEIPSLKRSSEGASRGVDPHIDGNE